MLRRPTLRWLIPAVLVVLPLSACSGSGDEVADAPPVEVQAAVDRFLDAVNAHDAEALRQAVNPAVFERIWAGQSFDIDYLAGRMDDFSGRALILEHTNQIAVHKNVTSENTYYVAVAARMTSDDENEPVNGVIVYTVSEFPDRGWLVTKQHNHGM